MKIGSTALHYAARFGNVPAVNTLVSAGADVDIVTMVYYCRLKSDAV